MRVGAFIIARRYTYLARKEVHAHGLRVDRRGDLVVPMRDADGQLWGVQTIRADGGKLYGKGARRTGTFAMLGEMQPGQPVIIAEGFATAATMREATGLPVAAAFDAGNLVEVARALRAQDPARVIVVAADNDHALPRRDPPLPNVGEVKARAAAAEVAGVVLLPAFPADSSGSDWNDYAAQHGKAAVRTLAAAALAPHGVTLPVAATAQAARQGVQQADRDAARQRPQQRAQTPAQDGASEAQRQAPELRPRGPRM